MEKIVSDTRRFNIRMDNSVAQYYDDMAKKKGVATPVLLREILTNHTHTIGANIQADRIEEIVNNLERKVDSFVENNIHGDKFYEDFSTTYMMLLWLMMKGEASKDDIRNMQSKGAAYAQKNFKGNDE